MTLPSVSRTPGRLSGPEDGKVGVLVKALLSQAAEVELDEKLCAVECCGTFNCCTVECCGGRLKSNLNGNMVT